MVKSKDAAETQKEAVAKNSLPVSPVAGAAGGAEDSNKAPPGRRAPGTKEPILFKWKLVADVQDAVLTLFKSVEREEADAQLARVQREGYYKNLRILDIDEKTKQPQISKAKKAALKDAETKAAKQSKTAAKKKVPQTHSVVRLKRKVTAKSKLAEEVKAASRATSKKGKKKAPAKTSKKKASAKTVKKMTPAKTAKKKGKTTKKAAKTSTAKKTTKSAASKKRKTTSKKKK